MTTSELLQQKDQEIAELSDEVLSLKQQLDWFKRQLFGRKSEKQIEDNPFQSSLFQKETAPTENPTPSTEVKAHEGEDGDCYEVIAVL